WPASWRWLYSSAIQCSVEGTHSPEQEESRLRPTGKTNGERMSIVDTREGLEFLSKHQPMPPDEELDQQLIDYYDEVRKWFILNPDPQCVPLFLNSFVKADGWGVSQLVGDAIIVFDKALVVPPLVKSLRNPNGSVSYWSAQIACSFPDAVLIAPLR